MKNLPSMKAKVSGRWQTGEKVIAHISSAMAASRAGSWYQPPLAKELNYEPNLLARSLATKQSHQVAVLIDDFANPYMLPSLGYLISRLQDEGLLAVVINVNENFSHVKAITNARQRQVNAIVSFGVSFDPKSVIENLALNSGVSDFCSR